MKWTQDENMLLTTQELFGQLCIDLAGMAAEELFLEDSMPWTNLYDVEHAKHLTDALMLRPLFEVSRLHPVLVVTFSG